MGARSRRRIALAALGVVVGLPVLAAGATALFFNPDHYKPQLIAALERATGRSLQIGSPLRLSFKPWPSLSAQDITLGNIPGGSQPAMATIAQAEVQFALLPLLSGRLVLDRLELDSPHILLERNAAGQANWLFHRRRNLGSAAVMPSAQEPQPASSQSPSSQPPSSQPPSPQAQTSPGPADSSGSTETPAPLEIHHLVLRDGVVSLHRLLRHAPDSADVSDGQLSITTLRVQGTDPQSPLRFSGVLRWSLQPVSQDPKQPQPAAITTPLLQLQGETGPLIRLLAPTPGLGAPWPLRVSLSTNARDNSATGNGAAGNGPSAITAEGSVRDPVAFKGWQFSLHGHLAALRELAPLLPGRVLPDLRDMRFDTDLAEADGPIPAISALRLSIGASDLAPWRPGVTLRALRAEMPNLHTALMLQADGTARGQPFTLATRLGPALTEGQHWQAMPLNMDASAGEARLHMAGQVADPSRMAGLTLTTGLNIPSLAAIAPLLGRPLPPLRDIALNATISSAAPLLQGPWQVQGLHATSSAGDLSGDVALARSPRPGISGQLSSNQIDLDALLAPAAPLPPLPTAAPAGSPNPGGMPPVPANPGLPAQNPSAQAPRAVMAAGSPLVPPIPMPLGRLRGYDAALDLQLGLLQWGGQSYRALAGHLALADGALRLDPWRMITPGGPVQLRLATDPAAIPPVLQIAAEAQGLRLAALLPSLGLALPMEGPMDVDLDLRGQGDTLATMAATATGHLGLAMVDGRLETAMFHGIPGTWRRILLGNAAEGSSTPLRCGALLLNARNGIARIGTLYADGPIGIVTGSGQFDLRLGTMALRLVPDLRGGEIAIKAPVALTGPITHPNFGVNDAALAAGIAQSLGQQFDPGVLQQLLGGGRTDCATALRLARGGRAGPEPGAALAPPKAPSLSNSAQKLLRGLFGR